ncbi:class A beta-lactamase-related serine hydrolase [Dyella sp. M7H15-1]|uniref:serine hydrolase domain-containing protein n=1 Tax=Dyella sp. M7H15-1 TaxID=2501295 RepID=UPI001004E9AB|nr:serine hydrolase domain-containing protein [Dyella sp. M7H15-1]QAU22757.1 class A beta-lactamase-related serine hydrolase [Dyella sp. M7H15-1]
MPFRKLPLLIAGALGITASLVATSVVHAATADGEPVPIAHPAQHDATDLNAASIPPERIKATLDAYSQWLDVVTQRNKVAGMATAVVIDNKVAFEREIGYADANTQEPVTADTVFRLASLSKAFATAVTGLLIDDGRFSWDTKLTDALPFFQLRDAEASNEATVKDILGQRLGLPHNTYDALLEDNVPYEELVRKLDEVSLTCNVGECYGYQNVAFSLIGDLIYAETGDFFYHQVDKRLFFPLGMASASYGRDALEGSKSWARPHRPKGVHAWESFDPKEAYYRVAPAAGVNASLHDMEQWLIAQMGGRPDILPQPLLDYLHAPGIPTPTEIRATPWRRARLTSASYGLGWRVFTYAGETMIFHAGEVEGYRTMIAFLPKYRLGMVSMWNSPGSVGTDLMPMVFDSMLGLPHIDWAGVDSDPSPGNAASVKPYHKHRHHD